MTLDTAIEIVREYIGGCAEDNAHPCVACVELGRNCVLSEEELKALEIVLRFAEVMK